MEVPISASHPAAIRAISASLSGMGHLPGRVAEEQLAALVLQHLVRFFGWICRSKNQYPGYACLSYSVRGTAYSAQQIHSGFYTRHTNLQAREPPRQTGGGR